MLRVLEKYELLEEIGHGGMATVYRARDTRLDREVAIKVLHPHLQKTHEARVRFTREARSAARLKHPNIVEIQDYGGEDSEESYIAAELLTGPTLKVFVEEHGEIPAEIAAALVLQIARALEAAHASGIVHRDVKPENVMLHEDRVVKLTDFGIAQMVDSQSFTATGQILGSPGHMAPEQVAAGDIDERSDIFSLGTVLYYLAVGRLPFTGRNPHQILKRIVDAEYPDPLRVRPSIGNELAEVIRKAMAREASERFTSAKAFAEELEAFLAGVDITEPDALVVEYLADPELVGARIRETSIAALLTRGRDALSNKERGKALECFNRILCLDESNEEVLTLVDRIGRPDRRPAIAVGVAAVVFSAAVAFAAWPSSVDPVVLDPIDIHAEIDAALADASFDSFVLDISADAGRDSGASTIGPTKIRATPLPFRGSRLVQFRPTPARVEIAVDEGEFQDFGPGFREVELPVGVHRFRFRSPTGCCEERDVRLTLRPDEEPYVLTQALDYRPALLIVRANILPARVSIAAEGDAAGAEGPAGGALRVPLGSASEVRRITVTAEGHEDYTTQVRLQAGEAQEVRANLVRTR